MILTIITFLIILGLLVFVHELGHFVVAKKSGMKVDEFGFGFPPRMFGLQKIEGKWKIVWGHKPPLDTEKTVYSINWIPLGGFVKIVGENNEQQDDPRSFINRPFWGRFATLVAGVVMNFILAWVLLSAGLVSGLPVAINELSDLPAHAQFKDPHVAILEVLDDQPAAKAGLMPGDTILTIDGQFFPISSQASDYIKEHKGSNFVFEVQRGGKKLSVSVQSNANPGPDQGPTGIALASVGKLSYPWYRVPYEGLKATFIEVENIGSGLVQLFSGHVSVKNLGGPVKIAQLTGEVRQMGVIYLLQFTAFLSINLAILNILPFPALDGGRVLFLIIEKVRGKRNNQKVEQWFNAIGFVLLILLMVFVTAHDIFNIFHK